MNPAVNPEFVALGLLWYVAFLFSLTCHEASHALVAKWGGDPTAAAGGQVTLNPLPHIRREIFGTTIVPILSYALGGWMIGWGSAPYDSHWRYRHPRRAAWMALAGPVANLTLTLIAFLAIRIGIFTGALEPPRSAQFTRVVVAAHPGFMEGVATLLSIVFSLNLLLAIFNLLPIPPLDGHGAICLFFTEDFARRFLQATRNPTLAIVGLIASWKVFGYLYSPLFLIALSVLYPGAGYR
ncbi:MAG TPA: site-2 protease family protein [Terriglobia bacterium]|nr:site-2 protease family protein [Terriglobia bacterium]